MTRTRSSRSFAGACALALLLAGGAGAHDRAARTDEALRDRVEDRLARSASLAGTEIEVDDARRVVQLNGVVGSKRERERASRIAGRVPGTRGVTTLLGVDADAVAARRQPVPDDELAKRVAARLGREIFPDADVSETWRSGWKIRGEYWAFDVDADGGAIELSGTVDEHDDIRKIRRFVRGVPGVERVETRLRVDFGP